MPALQQDHTTHTYGTPYHAGWWGFDLGAYRACDGTYGVTPTTWLPAPPDAQTLAAMPWAPIAQQEAQTGREALAPLLAQASELGLTLPPAFVEFFTTRAIHATIDSCTDCYFDLAEQIVADPTGRGWLVRFYADSQGCLFWYLYLEPGAGVAAVVAGDHFDSDMRWEDHVAQWLEEEPAWRAVEDAAAREAWLATGRDAGEPEPEPLPPEPAPAATDALWAVAPCFEEFVWRVWIENVLWLGAHAWRGAALTEPARADGEEVQRRAASSPA